MRSAFLIILSLLALPITHVYAQQLPDAKTLLERSGATLALENRQRPAHGAIVKISWPRTAFERKAGSTAAGEELRGSQEVGADSGVH